MFHKAQSTEDLVLLRQARPEVGKVIDCPRGRYPEGLFRLRVRLEEPEAIFCDEPAIVAESSPLFWDPGTAVQVLLSAMEEAGGAWTLSLTRWGVLRFEFRKQAGDPPALAVESRASIHTLVDVSRPFYVGVAMINPMAGEVFSFPETDRVARARVKLLIGPEAGPGLAVVGQAGGFRLPELRPLMGRLRVGAGEKGQRPTRAMIEELLVANTELFQVVDDPRPRPRPQAADVRYDFPGGSALAPCRVDEQTVALTAGVEFETSSSNYWYFFQVTDPKVRRIQVERVTEMSSCFFTSPDRREWSRTPMVHAGLTPQGDRRGIVQLPEHDRPLYVATAPVYGEVERDADLESARQLGAEVQVVATSTGGLPVHVVSLTDRSVPMAPAHPAHRKAGVVILCGQHSPVEQMGGWLGLACLQRLVELDRSAEHRGLLKQVAFYWVPILNIDCAHWGVPGNTLLWTNPNRQWMRNLGPEQQGVEEFLRGQRDHGVRMGLFIDIHAGGWRNHTILADYHADAEGCERPDRLAEPDRIKRQWFALLDRVAGLREVWVNPNNNGVLQRAPEWFQHEFAAPGFTIEMSVATYLDPVQRRTRQFTHQSLRDLGRTLAEALAAGKDLLAVKGTECAT